MIGRIYRLEGYEKFYIGSTTCELKYRLKKHKSKSNENVAKNTNVYKYFRNIGWENAKMILIKEFEISDRKELLQHEKDEIVKVKSDPNCLNTIFPIITEQEKKERDYEYSKKRRQNDPEKERLRLQKWRKENPEKRKQQIIREQMKKNLT